MRTYYIISGHWKNGLEIIDWISVYGRIVWTSAERVQLFIVERRDETTLNIGRRGGRGGRFGRKGESRFWGRKTFGE